jgi:DNA repair protein SbcD/Mre11
MRILHTSDWHLGRSFGQHRLLDDQARFLDWLVEVVRVEGIELVAVAGDLYDRSIPPAEAVELLADGLRRIRDAGAEVAAIAGNHDSAERVAAFDGLTDAGGVVLRGGYRRAAEVTIHHYADGPLALVTTPFLDPHLAPVDPNEGERGRRPTHESVLASTLDRARAAIPPGVRSLVLSHAFVTGAQPSASERELAVGTAGMVSCQVYDRFDYVALGHLHQPQVVAGQDHLRYCGSPLPYSFSETTAKQVLVVDLGAAGAVSVTPVAVPVGRPVVTIRGRFDEVLADPVHEPSGAAWVRVELTDVLPVVDAHRRLRARFPHLVEISRVAPRLAPTSGLTTTQLRRRSSAQVTADFWADVTGEVPSSTVSALLAQALAGSGSGP